MISQRPAELLWLMVTGQNNKFQWRKNKKKDRIIFQPTTACSENKADVTPLWNIAALNAPCVTADAVNLLHPAETHQSWAWIRM